MEKNSGGNPVSQDQDAPSPVGRVTMFSWATQLLKKAIQYVTLTALVGVGAWIFANGPIVSVESEAAFDPKDAYGSVIVVRNSGQMGVHSVKATCVVRETRFATGQEIDSWGIPARRENTFTSGMIGRGQDKFSFPCPQYFQLHRKKSGRGYLYAWSFNSAAETGSKQQDGLQAVDVDSALAEVSVTYTSPWRTTIQRYRRFLGKRSFEGKLVWIGTADSMHILAKENAGTRFKMVADQDAINPEAYTYSLTVMFGPETELLSTKDMDPKDVRKLRSR